MVAEVVMIQEKAAVRDQERADPSWPVQSPLSPIGGMALWWAFGAVF